MPQPCVRHANQSHICAACCELLQVNLASIIIYTKLLATKRRIFGVTMSLACRLAASRADWQLWTNRLKPSFHKMQIDKFKMYLWQFRCAKRSNLLSMAVMTAGTLVVAVYTVHAHRKLMSSLFYIFILVFGVTFVRNAAISWAPLSWVYWDTGYA